MFIHVSTVRAQIGQVWSRPVENKVLSHHFGWLQGALSMFNLNLPRSAWPKFMNIYRLLLHYLYICIKSLLRYLFLIIYFCTLLSSIYWSVLSVTPIFASCSVISIYLIYDLNFHFKQYIPCFARTGVEGNLGLYFVDDSRDVILTTQHGFTMTVCIKLDKDGHSYFDADLWRKMSKCYELKAGNKILVRAS